MGMFNEKETEGVVSVALTENTFGAGSYVVRVNRNTVELNDIVSDITAGSSSLDPYTIEHAVGLVKEKILKYLKEGRAVDVMGLGTLYPVAKGAVTRVNPQVADLPGLTLRFKPSKEAKAAIAAVRPASFMVRSPAPEITSIISLKDGSDAGTLYKGYSVRIKGTKLKVAGDAGGVFFVPPDAECLPNIDESTWIKAADSSYLPLNHPETLEFRAPDELEQGALYFIAVRTAYSPSGRLRKDAVVGFSARPVAISA